MLVRAWVCSLLALRVGEHIADVTKVVAKAQCVFLVASFVV